MLQVSNLVVDIAGSRIINDIDFEVRPGELVCMVGRNGAGKTTTFRSLMGYWPLTSGSIRFRHQVLAGLEPYKIARLGIGFSPEESEVFGSLTVSENIEMASRLGNSSESAAARVERAYRIFPKILSCQNRGGAQLSGGQRKMVSIARTVALAPDLFLLDEPFEGLAPSIIPDISDSIVAIRSSGASILMAESNIHHIPEDVDRVYVLERGKIIFAGSLEELREDRTAGAVVYGLSAELGS